jgi:hypothetical protein
VTEVVGARSVGATSKAVVNQSRRRLGQLRAKGLAHHWFTTYHSRPFGREPLTLLEQPTLDGAPRLFNIANLALNAGDLLLPVALRDLISRTMGPIAWQARHAHHVVTDRRVAELNRSDGVVIGGGGLFFADTNKNDLSGWQWSCSLDALARIDVPIALMGVGYNQFRGQDGFAPIFDEHVALLAEKATFIGLRNAGSVAAMQRHLPASLHDKLRLQPCATTLLGRIYPTLLERAGEARQGAGYVALNAAFDHLDLRLGDAKDEALRGIARAMKALAGDAEVRYVAHRPLDEGMLPYLDAEAVPYTLVRLYDCEPSDVLDLYAGAATVLGMRGHAQLIPFGCGRPIVSLISHDKVRYFLEDIGAEDWGVELRQPDLTARVVEVARAQLDAPALAEERIGAAQERLWDLTTDNLAQLADGFGLATRG